MGGVCVCVGGGSTLHIGQNILDMLQHHIMVVPIRNITLSVTTGHKVSTSVHRVYMYLLGVVSLKTFSVSNVLWQSCVDYSIMSWLKYHITELPLEAGLTHTLPSISDVSKQRRSDMVDLC